MHTNQRFSTAQLLLSFACGSAVMLVVGGWRGLGLGRGRRESSSSSSPVGPQARRGALREEASEKGDRTFTLSVTLNFRDAEMKHKYLSLLAGYARYVEEHEPTTLTYKIMQSDKDPLEMLLFERYVNKNAYLNIHRTSPEFLRYRESTTALSGGAPPGIVIRGASYDDDAIGFLSL